MQASLHKWNGEKERPYDPSYPQWFNKVIRLSKSLKEQGLVVCQCFKIWCCQYFLFLGSLHHLEFSNQMTSRQKNCARIVINLKYFQPQFMELRWYEDKQWTLALTMDKFFILVHYCLATQNSRQNHKTLPYIYVKLIFEWSDNIKV